MNRRQAKKILKKYGEWVPVDGSQNICYLDCGQFDAAVVLKAVKYKQDGVYLYSIPGLVLP